MSSFSKLNLSNELIKVLNDIGFDKPTHIQQQAIPLLNKKPIDLVLIGDSYTEGACVNSPYDIASVIEAKTNSNILNTSSIFLVK